jgi:hypothetical protein
MELSQVKKAFIKIKIGPFCMNILDAWKFRKHIFKLDTI